jgi:hypothetical protein
MNNYIYMKQMSLEAVKQIKESGEIIKLLSVKLATQQKQLEDLKAKQQEQQLNIQHIGPKPISIEQYKQRNLLKPTPAITTISVEDINKTGRKRKRGGAQSKLREQKGRISANQHIDKLIICKTPKEAREQQQLRLNFADSKKELKYRINNFARIKYGGHTI